MADAAVGTAYSPLPSAAHSEPAPEAKRGCTVRLVSPRLFLTKTAVIVVASYAFIPLIALHNAGRISAIAYASVLVALHVAFIVIYLYRVRWRELDGGDRRSIAARVLGLCACVYLLFLVAGHLADGLGLLAIELLGLCAVHTVILALLMTSVRLPNRGPAEDEVSTAAAP